MAVLSLKRNKIKMQADDVARRNPMHKKHLIILFVFFCVYAFFMIIRLDCLHRLYGTIIWKYLSWKTIVYLLCLKTHLFYVLYVQHFLAFLVRLQDMLWQSIALRVENLFMRYTYFLC